MVAGGFSQAGEVAKEGQGRQSCHKGKERAGKNSKKKLWY